MKQMETLIGQYMICCRFVLQVFTFINLFQLDKSEQSHRYVKGVFRLLHRELN